MSAVAVSVKTSGLHHHTRDPVGEQGIPQRQDLIRYRSPGGDRLTGPAAPAGAGDPDADLRVPFGDIDARAPGMHDIHHNLPRRRRWCRPVPGRAGRSKSDARARRQHSTVPVAPSTTMLTYRLAGTTEKTVSDRDGHRPSSVSRTDRTSPFLTAPTNRIFASHSEPSSKAPRACPGDLPGARGRSRR